MYVETPINAERASRTGHDPNIAHTH